MGAPGLRPPIPNGLHWHQADTGEWIPLEVENGMAYRLVRALMDGIASGELTGATMGPLVMPAIVKPKESK